MIHLLALFRVLIVALLLTAIGAGDAYAQRDKKKEENPYPNATRKEPKELATNEQIVKKLKKADEYFFDEDYDKAKALLDEIIAHKRASNYEKAFAYSRLSDIAWEKDEVDSAMNLRQQAVALDALDNKGQFDMMYALAQMALQDERYELALKTIDDWFRLSGADTADAWALKGNALYRMERYSEAGAAIKRAFALKPEGKPGWAEMLLASYSDAGQYDEAIKAGEDILVKNPGNKDVALRLVEAYNEAEQKDKALALLDKLRSAGSLTQQNDYLYLAQAYDGAEQYEKAAEVINDGLAKGVVKPGRDVYLRLGNAYSDAEKPQLAADAYCKGADASTDDGTLDYQCAYILVQDLEKFADGKRHAAAAVQKGNFKQIGEALVILGDAELELGNAAAARDAFTKALAYPSAKSLAESRLKNL
jgi:tetratricopeptide (TPR) repeat protein